MDVNEVIKELRLRIIRLKKEKQDLEEKVKQLEANVDKNNHGKGRIERASPQTPTASDIQEMILKSNNETRNMIKSLESSLSEQIACLNKDVQQIARDSVMTKYETEAIAIENEAKWKREKEDIMARLKQLLRDTEKKVTSAVEKITDEQQDNVLCTINGLITGMQEKK